ncbi:MAG: hypothetical protein ACRCY4_01950 [Brevinema sp.]
MMRSRVVSILLVVCCFSLSFAQYDGYDAYGGYEGGYEGYGDEGEYGDAYDFAEPDPLALPDTGAGARRAPPSSAGAAAAAMRSIPLFREPLPNFVIDPSNPTLPANHAFLKLRGSIWRGSERFFTTNQRGVVSAQRMYMVFAQERDAASFVLAPYDSPSVTTYPPVEDYVPLSPLIETNSFISSPYADKYIEIPEEYTRPTTNNMFLFNPAAQSNTNEASPEAVSPNLVTPPPTPTPNPTPIPGLESDMPNFDDYDLEGYGDSYGTYEGYDGYSFLPSFQDPVLFAQNAGSTFTYAVVNLGGMNGGVFQIADPQGMAAQFIVLLMVMDKDGELWAGTVRSSVDMRLNTAEAGQLRELYKKNLTSRINLKKYSPVFQSENKASSIFNFFK